MQSLAFFTQFRKPILSNTFLPFCRENCYFIFLIGEAKGCRAAGGQGDRVSHQPQEKG
jgi:hypothetical protein